MACDLGCMGLVSLWKCLFLPVGRELRGLGFRMLTTRHASRSEPHPNYLGLRSVSPGKSSVASAHHHGDGPLDQRDC